MGFADSIDQLTRAGVKFEPGLTSHEFADIEQLYCFTFPPDLRDFLGHALPVSAGWTDWRHATPTELRSRLNWPSEGICFDIEHNAFWPNSWGQKPINISDACKIARKAIDAAPRLIPIYGHRYIPDRPHESGNPVFSVHQSDIIYYGEDLLDYLCNEFLDQFERSKLAIESVKQIELWSEIANSGG